jgi:hypothetical protein
MSGLESAWPPNGARRMDLRRLVIAIGVEPDAMHGEIVPDNPARGQAQGRIGSVAERAPSEPDRRRERSPEVDANSSPIDRLFRSLVPKAAADHPDENKSGRTRWHERHVGPVGQKCR